MSWIGAGIGALFGAQRGGLLGGIIGAVAGNWLEGKAREFIGGGAQAQRGTASRDELATLAALAAMLSKMAKADGRVSEHEVRYCEELFNRLGLHGEKREYCIRVFRKAKNDPHSIYEYAASFAAEQPSMSVREVVYGILWDLACSDGVVSDEELQILRMIASSLRIDPSLYAWECGRRGVHSANADGGRTAESDEDPYSVIGCPRNASDDEVRRAYREKAKRLHPDALRAQGLSDELLSLANAQMARLNSAWAKVKAARNL